MLIEERNEIDKVNKSKSDEIIYRYIQRHGDDYSDIEYYDKASFIKKIMGEVKEIEKQLRGVQVEIIEKLSDQRLEAGQAFETRRGFGVSFH